MKLKYKKAILLILISTSGIGILTLSLTPNSNHKENAQTTAVDDVTVLSDVSGAATGTALATADSALPTEALAPISTPTPTPFPVYDLEEDAYPEIQTLFENFYAAKLSRNVDKMKLVMSNANNVPTKKQLEESTLFVEKYSNIKCYTKKGFEEGTYIVYVYNEVKFLNIKTPAPAVKKFYLITDDNGKLKIYPDELDEKTAEYYTLRDQDTDVQKLIKETNDKSEKAKDSDEFLKIFWEKLDKNHTSVQ